MVSYSYSRTVLTVGIVAVLGGGPLAPALLAREVAYVALDGARLAVVEISTGHLSAMIHLSADSTGLVASPDGRFVFVAERLSSSVAVVSTRSNTVIDRVEFPEPEPGAPFLPRALVTSPDGRRLYVSLDYPDGCPFEAAIATIDTGTRRFTTTGTVVGEGSITGIAAANDGALYAAVSGGCSDYFYYSGLAVGPHGATELWGELTLLERSTPVRTGDIAITRDARKAYVAVTDLDTVVVIDLPSLRRFEGTTRSVTVGTQPASLAVSPDGAWVLVGNRCGADADCGGPGRISIIDNTTDQVMDELPVAGLVEDIAVDSSGYRAYAVLRPSSIAVIAAPQMRLLRLIDLPFAPTHIALADVPALSQCADCDGNHFVGIEDLLTLVGVVLGHGSPADCWNGDRDGDGRVDVAELLFAVGQALHGCPAPGGALRD
jgi:DNA-binding beta-propeller fold protein YncE